MNIFIAMSTHATNNRNFILYMYAWVGNLDRGIQRYGTTYPSIAPELEINAELEPPFTAEF